jgi:CHAT domain-containing protein
MTEIIKILFLAANPAEMDPLQLGRESRAIDQALRTTSFRDRFVLEDHWAVQPKDLQELLLRYEPDVVHFSGHGAGADGIVLVDEYNEASPVSAAILGELLGYFAERVRCVVLNACYSDEQARQIAETVDCVIGIADAVADEDAIAFSTAFYRSLGYGKSVQTALALAQNEVAMGNRPQTFAPKLIALRTDPGSLYLVQPESAGSSANPAVVAPPSHSLSEAEENESHPALQQMAAGTPRLMLIVFGLLAVGLLALLLLPLLLPS